MPQYGIFESKPIELWLNFRKKPVLTIYTQGGKGKRGRIKGYIKFSPDGIQYCPPGARNYRPLIPWDELGSPNTD